LLNNQVGIEIRANGQLLEGEQAFSMDMLRQGVVLELASCVVLLLHILDSDISDDDNLDLIGESQAIRELRADIRRVADLDVPVLLRGETGVGKELVAKAIHELSNRSDRLFLCVNMAAVPPSMAASELFGHAKGAFTGATSSHDGYFAAAAGGTFFLDEIGATAAEVQPMLLRAVESGMVQPVGGALRKVDVRLIAATDADLELAVQEGTFIRPLLQRLAGYEMRIEPLRNRRADIGRLFIHFLRGELERSGEIERLQEPSFGKQSWLPAGFMAQLANYEWPGNVRQLKNVARQLAISNRGLHKFRIDTSLRSLLELEGEVLTKPEAQRPSPPTQTKRRRGELSDAEIVEALKQNRFNFTAAALQLDISRTWLNTRVEQIPSLRKAKDIGEDEIRRCMNEHGTDLDIVAAKLEVSPRALQLQMKRLGM